MASVHQFNEALAMVRGTPHATIEAYSRVLRREGVLPATRRGGGGPPLTTKMAGYMLAAVMRGSPINAAENAREIGDLIVHSAGGAMLEPVLDRQLAMLGWSADMSFASAIGWLIDRYVDGTINNFVAEGSRIEVTVDRYWTTASLQFWQPTLEIVEEYIAGWREALKDLEPRRLPERNLDGKLRHPMDIGFHSPFLHEAKISYGVDRERNRNAHRAFLEKKKRASKPDVSGTESVTERTLIALSDVFKDDGART